jgi:hypothetical protein
MKRISKSAVNTMFSTKIIERFDDFMGRLHMITTDLPKHRERSKPSGLMTSTNQRLWDALDWTNLQYSAGAPVEQLVEVWPYAWSGQKSTATSTLAIISRPKRAIT